MKKLDILLFFVLVVGVARPRSSFGLGIQLNVGNATAREALLSKRGRSGTDLLPELDADPDKLWCPNGQLGLPPTRHYILSAEPKSGTTWMQLLVEETVQAICHEYKNRTQKGTTTPLSVHCEVRCNDKNKQDRTFIDARNNCRSVIYFFTAKTETITATGAGTETGRHNSTMEISVHEKHTIPFVVSTGDDGHPNTTPLLAPIPGWLADCIKRGQYHCVPPAASVPGASVTRYLDEDEIQQVVRVINSSRESANGLPEETLRERIPSLPLGIFSIVRDPRAVVISAANYWPGRTLFGSAWTLNGVSGTPLADEFAFAEINTTVAWPQFRYHWLKNVLGHVLPVFQTFYEDMVHSPVQELRTMVHSFGLCYTDKLIEKIATENTQDYYKKTDQLRVQSVPMTRLHKNRPKDVVTGFKKEMSSVALGACNGSMLRTLQPSLLKQWMGPEYTVDALSMEIPHGPFHVPHLDGLRACCGSKSHTNSHNIWANGTCFEGDEAREAGKKARRKPISERKHARKRNRENQANASRHRFKTGALRRRDTEANSIIADEDVLTPRHLGTQCVKA